MTTTTNVYMIGIRESENGELISDKPQDVVNVRYPLSKNICQYLLKMTGRTMI